MPEPAIQNPGDPSAAEISPSPPLPVLSTVEGPLSPSPSPGQPKALDAEKQANVCSLVALGHSLRQAARFVGCDPKSIRREAGRNEDFRLRLARANSHAAVHPLETFRQAANSNWRAALSWMKRIEPDRRARRDASIVTKREANQFVNHLVELIEQAVKKPSERHHLFKLLTPAMPTAMRRPWAIKARRRAMERATQVFDNKKAERERRNILAKTERDFRRRTLWHEISHWLPMELLDKLAQNEDLFDPEEVFREPPGPGPLVNDPRGTYKTGSTGAQKYDPEIHGDRPTVSSSSPRPPGEGLGVRGVASTLSRENCNTTAGSPNDAQSPDVTSPGVATNDRPSPDNASPVDATNNAPPTPNTAPPPRPYSEPPAAEPPANVGTDNDLPTTGERGPPE